MDEHKQLVTTVRQTIYQRENLVDKIQFLLPEEYENHSLSDFTAILKYVDPTNVPHSEVQKIIKGINSVSTTNPELVRWFKNKEDADNISRIKVQETLLTAV